ncbi:MAG: DNA polymerase III subunit gamma/tau [Gammaproteobacteria bacterium]|nr:DNA polymerase III subunit gamma/tau [Gammaproteobacteria bacterium]
MSYLVLARKWRPKRFDELVGQEHVVRALTNALETGRVHHAFLFTGTRGVGKTTIARIFAKSLNCERGSGAEPCGECASCLDIDAGRFVDLLEIDAASNTGVDDVRALIENAQYMPARGRTKVYLVDEVHMLSKSAFNALLKTLEEPPGHVKFLLATTDPQKLPVTVLSRCLQFNLRRLEPEQIQGQMSRILQAEQIQADPQALALLARAADGSLRDGLSLLDQAIAYTGGKLEEAGVNAMLGTVERAQVGELLESLAAGDGGRLMAAVVEMAQYSPDFGHVLDDLATELHRIQLQQLVPGFQPEPSRIDTLGLASRLSPELVQLWYQMAVNGRRDLGYAPSTRAGFEMALLRMLAFRPSDGPRPDPARIPVATGSTPSATREATSAPTPAARPAVAQPTVAQPSVAQPTVVQPSVAQPSAAQQTVSATPAPVTAATAQPSRLDDADQWLALVAGSGLKGPALQLASHCAFINCDEDVLRVHLPEEDAHLRSESGVRQVTQAVATAIGRPVQIRFEAHPGGTGDTLHQRNQRQRSERQVAAEASFRADPVVSQLLGQGGSIVPDSIRPLSEN